MLEELQKRFDEIKDRRDDVTLRIHRALSWAKRGLEAEASEDPDAACIFYWIAFNAMYARKTNNYTEGREQKDIRDFLQMIAELDKARSVYQAMWDCWDEAKTGLIDNQFVYKSYWEHEKDVPNNADWELRLEQEKQRADQWHSKRDGFPALRLLFERLYVLRNQLHHGGSTQSGRTNRKQVDAGVAVMRKHIPAFISVILANPDAPWGNPYYPPVYDA